MAVGSKDPSPPHRTNQFQSPYPTTTGQVERSVIAPKV
jgi:hypothetical protein